MYGSGRGVVKAFLQGTGCEVSEMRSEMNPGFGGAHPEPIAKHLDPLVSAISAGKGTFGICSDGDADRIGAMDGRGNFVDPHKIMALAVKYLVEEARLDRVCRSYGLHHAHDRPACQTLWPDLA